MFKKLMFTLIFHLKTVLESGEQTIDSAIRYGVPFMVKDTTISGLIADESNKFMNWILRIVSRFRFVDMKIMVIGHEVTIDGKLVLIQKVSVTLLIDAGIIKNMIAGGQLSKDTPVLATGDYSDAVMIGGTFQALRQQLSTLPGGCEFTGLEFNSKKTDAACQMESRVYPVTFPVTKPEAETGGVSG